MQYPDAAAHLADYRRQIAAIREKMRETQAVAEPQEVSDYEFQTPEGAIRLSQLFGDHEVLIVIHNMGSSCPACTMWADGYNGIHHHVATRAAFVVSSPEPPEAQRKFAASRGWKFPMISHAGSTSHTRHPGKPRQVGHCREAPVRRALSQLGFRARVESAGLVEAAGS